MRSRGAVVSITDNSAIGKPREAVLPSCLETDPAACRIYPAELLAPGSLSAFMHVIYIRAQTPDSNSMIRVTCNDRTLCSKETGQLKTEVVTVKHQGCRNITIVLSSRLCAPKQVQPHSRRCGPARPRLSPT
jgi:hypothetical protein